MVGVLLVYISLGSRFMVSFVWISCMCVVRFVILNCILGLNFVVWYSCLVYVWEVVFVGFRI